MRSYEHMEDPRYWCDELGVPRAYINTDGEVYGARVVRKRPKQYRRRSGRPGGLLKLRGDGTPTTATRKALEAAWAYFLERVPEAKSLKRDDTDSFRADDDHRKVWRYLVDENGKSRSVDEAYELYKADHAKGFMSKATFTAYCEVVPRGTMNWVYVMDQKYVDPEVQMYRDWCRWTDGDDISKWAKKMPDYIAKLTKAERAAVEDFISGEDTLASSHPRYKAFQRARKKLYDLLVKDGYEFIRSKPLRSSSEGNGGRSFCMNQVSTRFRVPSTDGGYRTLGATLPPYIP